MTDNPIRLIKTWFGSTPIARTEVLAWESRRAAKALKRLGVAVPDGDVDERRAALLAAKTSAGRLNTEQRLAREIAITDRLTRTLARASGRRRQLCQVELLVLADGITADQLPNWYMHRSQADDEAAFLNACPDHHLFRPTPNGQEVWETTGNSPLSSRFFFTFDETDAVLTQADPTYPVQMAGTARLADRTVVGGIRHQFRNENNGVRVLLTVEMPKLIGPVLPSAHRWHLAAEFSNWMTAAAAEG